MDFGNKLKDIRKREGLSQEQLAEKIGVSRQAITKWETGRGLPDLENMTILAEIFKTTLDELVFEEKARLPRGAQRYRSETIYDIDGKKHFDIRLGTVRDITLRAGGDEKLHVALESETLENLETLFKIRLDEKRQKLDVDCLKKADLSAAEAGRALSVIITLPLDYTSHCELEASAGEVRFSGLSLDRFEYDGDAGQVRVENCSGSLEFSSKSDCDITIDRINKRLDITQFKANTLLHIPESADFRVQNTGRKCRVYWSRKGQVCEDLQTADSENVLYVTGIKSEVMIDVTG